LGSTPRDPWRAKKAVARGKEDGFAEVRRSVPGVSLFSLRGGKDECPTSVPLQRFVLDTSPRGETRELAVWNLAQLGYDVAADEPMSAAATEIRDGDFDPDPFETWWRGVEIEPCERMRTRRQLALPVDIARTIASVPPVINGSNSFERRRSLGFGRYICVRNIHEGFS
jgi:hypothetical protein